MANHWHYKKGDVVGGIYYLTTEGKEVYVYGGGQGVVRYLTDKGEHLDTTDEIVHTWQPLDNVQFSNDKDNALPYVFDLHWDCKSVNGLIRELEHGWSFDRQEDKEHLLELLNDPETFKDQRYKVTQQDIEKMKKAVEENL